MRSPRILSDGSEDNSHRTKIFGENWPDNALLALVDRNTPDETIAAVAKMEARTILDTTGTIVIGIEDGLLDERDRLRCIAFLDSRNQLHGAN